MKTLLALFLLAMPLAADVTVTLTPTQDALAARALLAVNTKVCTDAGLIAGCTQVALRAIPGHANDVVYPDVAALSKALLVQEVTRIKGQIADPADSATATALYATLKTNFPAMTTVQKNTVCVGMGLSAGCTLP